MGYQFWIFAAVIAVFPGVAGAADTISSDVNGTVPAAHQWEQKAVNKSVVIDPAKAVQASQQTLVKDEIKSKPDAGIEEDIEIRKKLFSVPKGSQIEGLTEEESKQYWELVAKKESLIAAEASGKHMETGPAVWKMLEQINQLEAKAINAYKNKGDSGSVTGDDAEMRKQLFDVPQGSQIEGLTEKESKLYWRLVGLKEARIKNMNADENEPAVRQLQARIDSMEAKAISAYKSAIYNEKTVSVQAGKEKGTFIFTTESGKKIPLKTREIINMLNGSGNRKGSLTKGEKAAIAYKVLEAMGGEPLMREGKSPVYGNVAEMKKFIQQIKSPALLQALRTEAKKRNFYGSIGNKVIELVDKRLRQYGIKPHDETIVIKPDLGGKVK